MDFDALGAQYRDAKEAIGEHRRRQAQAEVTYARLRRRLPDDAPELAAARSAVDKAVADVAWCQAVTVAAGEAFKGVPFAEVPQDRRVANEAKADAMKLLNPGGS